MRDIKFRAWVKTIEDMYSWERLVHQNNWWEDKNYILMQYTELKDKNGKESYFQDLIKIEDGIKGLREGIYEVLWNDAGFIELKEINSTETISTWAPSKAIGEGEIIGNIYENPELLK